jgi:hypothetical protein
VSSGRSPCIGKVEEPYRDMELEVVSDTASDQNMEN